MKKINRSAVIINYISVLMMLFIFYAVQWLGLSRVLFIVEIIPLIALIISFNFAFNRTGLWKFIHKSQRRLDEREIQILHKAIRMSYNIFVILCLLLILIFAVLEGSPIDVILMVSLGYLSHTLPAAVITFCREEI